MLRWLPLALVTVLAFWLRTHDLAKRPMHADEANQAVKLGDLLETGRYAFDPRDHHGPTLYYAAVPIALLRGQRTLAALDETTVRLVPAIFGTAAVVLLAALAAPLGYWPALGAALLFAVAPPAVYYSRYFIQETLLLTFFLAAILCFRTWWRTGRTRWALACGASVGLMQATKATAPLFLAFAGLGLLLCRRDARAAAPRISRDLALGMLAAFFVGGLLFSSFGTHLAGLGDALNVYGQAFLRFGATAPPTGHEKPWWYYLQLFTAQRTGGMLWFQAPFFALALVGVGVAVRRADPWARGVALYTVAIVGAFSFFAYKTPWHAVHFVPAFALLAGVALAALTRLRTGWVVATMAVFLVAASQLQQTYRVAFLRPADQRNPYAYVHSAPDVLKFRAAAEAGLAVAPDAPIRVIADEYWPLPWYFRGLPHVGYYAAPPDNCDGALVVTSAAHADFVRSRLKSQYRETFLGLRPGVLCHVFIAER